MTNTGKNALPRMKVLIAAARRPLNNSLQGLPMLNQDAIHAIIRRQLNINDERGLTNS
jgi:septum formation topological specificity factor MinE